MNRLHIDYETFSQADLKDVGAWRYAQDPSTGILCAAFAIDDAPPVVWHQDMSTKNLDDLEPYFRALEDPSVLIYCHNASFEHAISASLMEKTFGVSCPHVSRWRCTMSLARRAALPAKLEKLAEALGLENQKDNKGKALIRKFSIMQPAPRVSKKNPNGGVPFRIKPEDDLGAFTDFMNYCAQDVRVEQEIAKRLAYFDEPINNANYTLHEVINARGVAVNVDALLHAQALIEEETELQAAAFRAITGFEMTQNAKLLTWVNSKGYTFENLQAETVDSFLEEREGPGYEDQDVVCALRIKQSTAYVSIKKVATMLDCVGEDGRIRGLVSHHGATTGRSTSQLVQFQNMKRPTIKDSEQAYANICAGVSREMLELSYGPPLEVISSCVRHFVDAGQPILDADYAAIEARIVCWLAGQEDALDEYRQGIDRYKVMASLIYGIPVEQVNKHPQRFVGKAAVLGAGFGLGPKRFRFMCAQQGYDLPLGLEDKAIKAFRLKHAKVKQYWSDVEKAAKQAIVNKGRTVVLRNVAFQHRDIEGTPFLLLRLPSGRKLAYPHPKIVGHSKFEGQTAINFYGHQFGTNWGNVETHGPKLVENCLSGDTRVLSQARGWVPLRTVTTEDKLWDGVAFVLQGGLVAKGEQDVIDCHGVWATPDHKFLMEGKWVDAQTACTVTLGKLSFLHETIGTTRKNLRKHDSHQARSGEEEEVLVDMPVRVRKVVREARSGPDGQKEGAHRLRNEVPCYFESHGQTENSRDESAPRLLGVEEHERQVQALNSPSLAQLRRAWDYCVRQMGRVFRGILGRHGSNLQERSGHRSERQQQGLLPRELPVGDQKTQLTEPEEHSGTRRGTPRFLGCSSSQRDQEVNALLQAKSRNDLATNPKHTSGRKEQVYDILNCGPLNRFAVKANAGRVMIAHNCTQAVAADIMLHGTHNAEKAGYEVMTLIHDQALAYHKPGQTVEEFVKLLTDLPPWADGLPIDAEGKLTPFYSKG